MTRWKPGSDSARPGVSAQPGCMALNETAVAASRARPLADQRDLDALRLGVSAGADVRPVRPAGRRMTRCVYIPPDVTAMTRARACLRSSGIKAASSANGPTTSMARVRSMPSSVSWRSG